MVCRPVRTGRNIKTSTRVSIIHRMNAVPDSQMQAIIRLENIERSYWMGAETIHALHGVSLTSVDLSRDLSVARVYFSLLNPDDSPDAALEGLQRAAGFLRSKLGAAIKVRHVPELRFVHDDSAEQGAKISELIDSALHADDHG